MRRLTVLALLAVLGLAACAAEDIKTEASYPVRRQGDGDTVYTDKKSSGGVGNRPGIFGGNGTLGIFGKDKKEADGVGITVNAYLWRASLDTLSFMPLASADPFGGTILTDWYSPPETKNERIKVNAMILSRELRTDALKVSVFRQINTGGGWKDAQVSPKTVNDLEDAILTRARQLKVAAADK